MTGLALLAHSAAAAAPAFNGLFYATVATIIPVLFLAVAVQGGMLADMLRAAGDALTRASESSDSIRPGMLAITLITAIALVVLFLVYAVVAEIASLDALLRQGPDFMSPAAVLEAVIWLTIATAGPPAVALARFLRSTWREHLMQALWASSRSDKTDAAGGVKDSSETSEG